MLFCHNMEVLGKLSNDKSLMFIPELPKQFYSHVMVVLLAKFSVEPRKTHQDAILYVFDLLWM